MVTVGISAFEEHALLNTINLNNVEVLEAGAFASTGLVNFSSNGKLTTIGGGAFRNCTLLTSAHLPNSVTSIGNNAFYDCSSLTSIIIPDSVTSIGSGLCQNCTSLESIVLSKNVTQLGTFNTFSSCTSLKDIYLRADSLVTCSSANLFIGCSNVRIHVRPGLESLYLTNSVWSLLVSENNFTIIGDYNYE